VNNCNFIGRIGKDAVIRYTQGGKAVTGWSLAVDSGWGDKKQTVWIDCNLWGDRGEKLSEYLVKGAQVGVTGELGTREHDGKTYVTLNVSNVTLIGGKPEGQQRPARAPASSPKKEPSDDILDDFSDDIPFNQVAHDNH